MMVGRHRKPANLHALEGNPSKLSKAEMEQRLKSERKVDVSVPDPPEFLDNIALKEWNRVTPILERLGIINHVDQAALAGYCSTYSKWYQIEKVLKRNKFIQCETLEDGQRIYSLKNTKLLAESKTLLVQIRAFCSEFGFTPSSRARLNFTNVESKLDEFESLLDS